MLAGAQMQRLRQWQQQHEISLEKDRDREHVAAGEDGMSGATFTEEREEAPHHLVRAAAFYETDANHGSKCDDHADFRRRFTEAFNG